MYFRDIQLQMLHDFWEIKGGNILMFILSLYQRFQKELYSWIEQISSNVVKDEHLAGIYII